MAGRQGEGKAEDPAASIPVRILPEQGAAALRAAGFSFLWDQRELSKTAGLEH